MKTLPGQTVVSPSVEPTISLPQLPYRHGVVYGPIQSRRIGWSLGVNLLPQDHRLCTFDCMYCQFPSPHRVEALRHELERLTRVPELYPVIEHGIRQRLTHRARFDSVSFVGNGDPSVHPDLFQVAQFTRELLARLGLHVPLTIFTNAVPYADPRFIEALRVFDQRLIKLDAGDERTFQEINKPRVDVDLEDLADSIGQLDGIIVQTMVVRGRTDNRASIASARFAGLVRRLHASELQLTTIDKRPAYSGVLPVLEDELHKIANLLRARVDARVKVFYQDCPSGFPSDEVPCSDPWTCPGVPEKP